MYGARGQPRKIGRLNLERLIWRGIQLSFQIFLRAFYGTFYGTFYI